MESVEDQQKFLIPLDRNTEKLFYNQRLIIDNRVLSQPRAWRITKVNRVGYNGLAMITCAQDIFDEHKDYIELDNNGNVIGMWADYYSSSISPKDNEESKSDTIYSKISYSGLKPEIKIAGSYKKFTVNFYDKDVEIPFKQGNWYIYDGDIDVSNLFDIKTDPDILNQIKIKFLGDLSYKGNVYSIKYISNDGIETSEDIEIQTL